MRAKYNCQQMGTDYITAATNPHNANVYLTVSDMGDRSEIELSRENALSLAWDIIEHFEDGTRPVPAIKVGDYVKGNLGIIGRVTFINDEMLSAKALHGIFSWYISDCTLVTEQEFIDYCQQQIADITDGQD